MNTFSIDELKGDDLNSSIYYPAHSIEDYTYKTIPLSRLNINSIYNAISDLYDNYKIFGFKRKSFFSDKNIPIQKIDIPIIYNYLEAQAKIKEIKDVPLSHEEQIARARRSTSPIKRREAGYYKRKYRKTRNSRNRRKNKTRTLKNKRHQSWSRIK